MQLTVRAFWSWDDRDKGIVMISGLNGTERGAVALGWVSCMAKSGSFPGSLLSLKQLAALRWTSILSGKHCVCILFLISISFSPTALLEHNIQKKNKCN